MSDKKITYFITGGGTGGHIYPAVAVVDALLQDEDTKAVYYIGNPDNLEYSIISKKPVQFLGINIHGMPRRFGFAFVKWAFQLWLAWLKCCFYIFKYRPDVVFGTGGYVSAPILMACMSFVRGNKRRFTPYMMHDCDAQPGLVTRGLAKHAKLVSLAFECAKEHIHNKNCVINGNPIREEFKTLTKEQARKKLGLENKLTLCIMGGSQGAMSINNAAVGLLRQLSDAGVQVIFQTGKKNFERVIEQLIKIYPEYDDDKNIIIKPYFDDMVTVLKASDMAVSRSGSLSLSEIEAAGIAAILVPYPHAAADHQRKNAKFLLEKDAALYIEDKEINEKILSEKLFELINSPARLAEIQKNALSLAKFDSTENIVQQLKNIAQGQ